MTFIFTQFTKSFRFHNDTKLDLVNPTDSKLKQIKTTKLKTKLKFFASVHKSIFFIC